MPANGCAAVKEGRRDVPAVRWVQFTISPLVGFGDDWPASRLHHGGSSEGGRSVGYLPCCGRLRPFSQNKTAAESPRRPVCISDLRFHPSDVSSNRASMLRASINLTPSRLLDLRRPSATARSIVFRQT